MQGNMSLQNVTIRTSSRENWTNETNDAERLVTLNEDDNLPFFRVKSLNILKGTVPPDFSPLVFLLKQLLLAPVDKPGNDFDFFRIFTEIFDFSGASPVSLTLAKQTILLQLDDSFELWMDAIEK